MDDQADIKTRAVWDVGKGPGRLPVWRSRRWLLTLVICVLPAAYWGWAMAGRSPTESGWQTFESLHNPGPLTTAHSFIAADCAQCHAGDGRGGYSRAVTDTACLHCHDAAVHHVDQKEFVDRTSAHAHSADCLHCHTEHRGMDQLVGTSDQFCVQCHGNIGAHSLHPDRAGGNVAAFNATGGHPHFGASLHVASDGKFPAGTTQLKFSHATHCGKYSKQAGNEKLAECRSCHTELSPDPTPAFAKSAGDGTERDRPIEAANDDALRAMQPVDFDTHCMKCHAIVTPGSGTPLPHRALSIVRGQLATLDKQGGDAGQKAVQDAGTEVDNAITNLSGDVAKDPVFKAALASGLVKSAADTSEIGTFADAKQMTPALADMLEVLVAYQTQNSCVKCHAIGGDLPMYAAMRAGRPALETKATHIPRQPRVWYVNARFDHRAHRFMSCLSCHVDAQKSASLEDDLLPDIELAKKDAGNAGARSCVDCHHGTLGDQGSAASNCVSCHIYHDRTKEVAPASARPTTQPAKSMAMGK